MTDGLEWSNRFLTGRAFSRVLLGGRRHRIGAILLLALAVPGCSPAGGVPNPAPNAPRGLEAGWAEVGVASWYGEPFHGRTTASGETYDMEAATAAHRTLPFGTRLRVENLDNGRTAVVTVNDRGPFVDDRVLDVSRRIARELGMVGPGTARVRLTVLDAPAPRECWLVQVGAFREEDNAQALHGRIAAEGLEVRALPSPDGLYRVQVGPFSDPDSAREVVDRYGGFLFGC